MLECWWLIVVKPVSVVECKCHSCGDGVGKWWLQAAHCWKTAGEETKRETGLAIRPEALPAASLIMPSSRITSVWLLR